MAPAIRSTRWGLRKVFDLFLFTSTYLAICAMGMVYQTLHLFGLGVDPALLAFTFFGTLTSYNFHWYLTPASFSGTYKTDWSVRNKKLHGVLFLTGICGAAIAGWHLRQHWPWLLLTAFITFLYSAPKVPLYLTRQLQRIAVGKTFFLAFAWAHVTALLPLLLADRTNSGSAFFFVLNRFLLIYAICLLFDYRDRESDKEEGIRSLPTKLDEREIIALFRAIIAGFLLTLPLLHLYGFPLPVLAALALPGLIAGWLRGYSMEQKSDYYYYFILDGLLALSFPLVCFL